MVRSILHLIYARSTACKLIQLFAESLQVIASQRLMPDLLFVFCLLNSYLCYENLLCLCFQIVTAIIVLELRNWLNLILNRAI